MMTPVRNCKDNCVAFVNINMRCTVGLCRRTYQLFRTICPWISAVLRSNPRYGPLLLHDAHYAHAGATASEYSWCKPPKIDRTRTSTSVTNRWRDSDFGATTDSLGGSGTPGPNEL